MAAGRLTTQERKDLERFTKFLIYKSLQIIVQSRLGDKIKTQSKPVSSGADWFNIAIKDIPEVQSEAKKLLAEKQFNIGQNICMEILLKTCDGDTMTLEIWYLSVSDQSDLTMRTPHAAYYRMGVALKSVFSISRSTPAYKLSRQQGPDNYVLFYRMYFGDPKYYLLGDGYKTAKVTAVPMTTGNISIHVAYRIKLQLSPQHSGCHACFDVKYDHFKNDGTSSKTNRARACNNEYNRVVARATNMDTGKITVPIFRNVSRDKPNNSPVGRRKSEDEGDSTQGSCSDDKHFMTSRPIAIVKHQQQYEMCPDDFLPNSTPDSAPNSHPQRKVSAFAPQHSLKDYKMDLDDVPFENLLRSVDMVDAAPVSGPIPGKQTSRGNGSADTITQSSTVTNIAGADNECTDFVMLELKTPFAGDDSGSELNKFYRDCQTAPTLRMCNEVADVDSTLDNITDQLKMFETSMKDFDNFVSSLQDSD